MLWDPSRRPLVPRAPVARELIEHNPEDQVVLDGELLLQNLRESRRGAAAGPSGLTEHLREILDSEADSVAFCEFARRSPTRSHEGQLFGSHDRATKHTGHAVFPGSTEGNFSVPIRFVHKGRNRGRDPRV